MLFVPNGLELLQDLTVFIIGLILIFIVIIIGDLLKNKEMATAYFTRKMIHIAAGTIYLLSWLFFSGEWFSPYIAVAGAGTFALLFSLVGSGIIKNEKFVASMCRSGEASELLRGTLFYAIVMMIASMFFFYSPVSIVLVMTLAFGDGLADVVGRKANRMKFKVFAEKSVPGSAAMFFFSLISSLVVLAIFNYDLVEMWPLITLIILVATIVEAISPKEMDNLTIPAVIIIVFFLLTPVMVPSAQWSLFHVFVP
ncbi:MAG: diacylglycerol/polyprenol kinase family protein [Candidatus Hodarchaeales archaeon]